MASALFVVGDRPAHTLRPASGCLTRIEDACERHATTG